MQNQILESSGPWWKFGLVWMVVAGPVAVVLASFVTVYLAVTRPDPVVSADYYRQGIQINQRLEAQAAASLAPAVQARNHAATGVAPPVQPVKP
jgi:hypothetical protein